MKILTKDNKVVEGTEIGEAASKLVDDVNNDNIVGVSLYSHQRSHMIQYILGTFELTLKPKPDAYEQEATLAE